jgi:muramoyltetrapeptide carboxypeptidase
MITIPAYLQKGDIIGIICPSGYMPLENMETCLKVLEESGFVLKKGKTLGTHFNYFSGTDEERLEDLQLMLDDDNVKAVLCARGGYGLSRIIDDINFGKFLAKPKWIIGFSDITVLHSHLFQNFQVASLHSPMAAAFNNGGSETEYVQSLLEAVKGNPYKYYCEGYKLNKQGVATDELVGGNLCLLAHLIGSKSSMNMKGKLLFIEETGEHIYNIDRLMLQLQRAGMLEELAGLVVGSFTDMKDTVIPFGESVYDLIYDKVKDYNYPVCFNFPVGHTRENYALKHGVLHTLEVNEYRVVLTEKS